MGGAHRGAPELKPDGYDALTARAVGAIALGEVAGQLGVRDIQALDLARYDDLVSLGYDTPR